MIRYSFLNNTPVDIRYYAFLAAFADYQVDMRMSIEDFEFRLRRDGVDETISVGAFDADQLVGFCLNGSGTWQGEPTVYDAGTGVLPHYRGQGLASEMFRFMNPQLKERGFKRYLLEVLTSNKPAVNLYRRLGFEQTRRLAVFRTTNRLSNRTGTVAEIHQAEVPNWNLYQTFWTGYPSWQNSIEAAQRVAGTTATVEYHVDHQCVGYGVISKTSGNLFQLAVDKNYRRKGVASMLLNALQNSVTSLEFIKVNNVDENLEEAMAFFTAVGFKLTLQQYEMVLNLCD
ncbi:MAG TPA: GNAT family N-acetyltransferase [Pyrinomonadaceae bacterium]|nr:GNAT family N-acetyltransferase [Pyrinomonadaceae bacterium]